MRGRVEVVSSRDDDPVPGQRPVTSGHTALHCNHRSTTLALAPTGQWDSFYRHCPLNTSDLDGRISIKYLNEPLSVYLHPKLDI